MTLPQLLTAYDYAIVDVETTGVRSHDELCQIAIIHVDKGGYVSWRSYVHVRPQVPVSERAAELHGLTDAHLVYAHTIEQHRDKIRERLEERVLLGFNIDSFDLRFLKKAQVLPERGCAVDVMRLLKALEPVPAGTPLKGFYTLEAAHKRWGGFTVPSHDALRDCQATWQLYASMVLQRPELQHADLQGALSLYRKELR